MKPVRIQRKRTKGWKMPPNTVYVGRPSKWGNPFAVGVTIKRDSELAPWLQIPGGWTGFSEIKMLDVQSVVNTYDRWLCEQPHLMLSVKEELGGKNLACWCPLDEPCHADVLLEIANQDKGEI